MLLTLHHPVTRRHTHTHTPPILLMIHGKHIHKAGTGTYNHKPILLVSHAISVNMISIFYVMNQFNSNEFITEFITTERSVHLFLSSKIIDKFEVRTKAALTVFII